jgi:hypothetical protein
LVSGTGIYGVRVISDSGKLMLAGRRRRAYIDEIAIKHQRVEAYLHFERRWGVGG